MSGKSGISSRASSESGTSEEAPVEQRFVYLLHIREVARQAGFASIAFHNIRELLSTGCVLERQAFQAHKTRDEKTLEEMQTRMRCDGVLFWYHLQAFLTSWGDLSRQLWPGKKADGNRGVFLRNLFKVDEASPLKNRDLRDHFEHFDERLDKWGLGVSARDFADELVVFPGQSNPLESGISPESCMRIFYVSDMCASFYGKRYQLQPVADEVARIFPLALNYTNAIYQSLQK